MISSKGQQMDVVITDQSGVTKAELAGRLDTANVNELEQQFTTGILPKAQNTMVRRGMLKIPARKRGATTLPTGSMAIIDSAVI